MKKIYWSIESAGRYTTDPPARLVIDEPKKKNRIHPNPTNLSLQRLINLSEYHGVEIADGILTVYDVFYARNPHFIDSGPKYGPPLYTIATLPNTHEHIRTIEAESLDDVFRQSQSEWEPHGNILASILSLDKPHTLMSVNDVVRDPNGDYYECLSAGWGKLD